MKLENFSDHYDEENDITGVYAIRNIENNRFYVGQSLRIYQRIYTHFINLKNNKHHNKKMQQDFNLYGANSFSVVVLEQCEPTDLDRYESIYSHKYDVWNKGYGIGGLLDYRNLTKKEVEDWKGKILNFLFSEQISGLVTAEMISPIFKLSLNDIKVILNSINDNDENRYDAFFFVGQNGYTLHIKRNKKEILKQAQESTKNLSLGKGPSSKKIKKRKITEEEMNDFLRNWVPPWHR